MPDVYEFETIEETPFPGEPAVLSTRSRATGGVVTPTAIKDKTFPTKKVSHELLSTALNTRSRKILQEFDLQQSGGLKVGDFKSGISGDLRITPNGLTARDIAGLITFAIDGSDGSAVFKGEIRSGSLVTGEVVVGDDAVKIDGTDGNGKMVINDKSTGLDIILIGFQKNGFS
jgi:hypothetical protein|tara:strand:+ start:126 stop:644 length:519 start_codon:yes stop_codon:yes gene_type:complete